jgi:hypothetical protein
VVVVVVVAAAVFMVVRLTAVLMNIVITSASVPEDYMLV